MTVELNLTPVNPHRKDSWVEQVFGLVIRAHHTMIDPVRDRMYRHVQRNKHSIIYREVKRAMLGEVPIELVHRLLCDEFIDYIDWERYIAQRRPERGSNVPFALCKRVDL